MDLSKPAVRRLVSFDRTCDSGSQSRSNSRGRASQVIAKPLVTINGVVATDGSPCADRSTLRNFSGPIRSAAICRDLAGCYAGRPIEVSRATASSNKCL